MPKYIDTCSARAAIWPDQEAENILQLFLSGNARRQTFLYILHLTKKKMKEGIYLTPERMQNLLRGEQELRQGKNHVKEIITCKE